MLPTPTYKDGLGAWGIAVEDETQEPLIFREVLLGATGIREKAEKIILATESLESLFSTQSGQCVMKKDREVCWL